MYFGGSSEAEPPPDGGTAGDSSSTAPSSGYTLVAAHSEGEVVTELRSRLANSVPKAEFDAVVLENKRLKGELRSAKSSIVELKRENYKMVERSSSQKLELLEELGVLQSEMAKSREETDSVLDEDFDLKARVTSLTERMIESRDAITKLAQDNSALKSRLQATSKQLSAALEEVDKQRSAALSFASAATSSKKKKKATPGFVPPMSPDMYGMTPLSADDSGAKDTFVFGSKTLAPFDLKNPDLVAGGKGASGGGVAAGSRPSDSPKSDLPPVAVVRTRGSTEVHYMSDVGMSASPHLILEEKEEMLESERQWKLRLDELRAQHKIELQRVRKGHEFQIVQLNARLHELQSARDRRGTVDAIHASLQEMETTHESIEDELRRQLDEIRTVMEQREISSKAILEQVNEQWTNYKSMAESEIEMLKQRIVSFEDGNVEVTLTIDLDELAHSAPSHRPPLPPDSGSFDAYDYGHEYNDSDDSLALSEDFSYYISASPFPGAGASFGFGGRKESDSSLYSAPGSDFFLSPRTRLGSGSPLATTRSVGRRPALCGRKSAGVSGIQVHPRGSRTPMPPRVHSVHSVHSAHAAAHSLSHSSHAPSAGAGIYDLHMAAAMSLASPDAIRGRASAGPRTLASPPSAAQMLQHVRGSKSVGVPSPRGLPVRSRRIQGQRSSARLVSMDSTSDRKKQTTKIVPSTYYLKDGSGKFSASVSEVGVRSSPLMDDTSATGLTEQRAAGDDWLGAFKRRIFGQSSTPEPVSTSKSDGLPDVRTAMSRSLGVSASDFERMAAMGEVELRTRVMTVARDNKVLAENLKMANSKLLILKGSLDQEHSRRKKLQVKFDTERHQWKLHRQTMTDQIDEVSKMIKKSQSALRSKVEANAQLRDQLQTVHRQYKVLAKRLTAGGGGAIGSREEDAARIQSLGKQVENQRGQLAALQSQLQQRDYVIDSLQKQMQQREYAIRELQMQYKATREQLTKKVPTSKAEVLEQQIKVLKTQRKVLVKEIKDLRKGNEALKKMLRSSASIRADRDRSSRRKRKKPRGD